MAYSRGAQSVDDYFIGDWDYVQFVVDPLGTPAEYLLGMTVDASLEITREDYEHQGNTFPRVVDFTAVVSVGMTFSATFQEWSLNNLALAIGQDPAGLTGSPGSYIYPATSCSDTNLYGNLVLNRTQCGVSGTPNMIEVKFWKARAGGSLSFGGGEEINGSPAEWTAQDDRAGTYGGSATAPLGYIYHTDN